MASRSGVDAIMLRGVLATLLLSPNRFVSALQLASALWRVPPASAEANLRTYIARLRRVLGADTPRLAERMTHVRRSGYRLAGEPFEFDYLVFRSLAKAGRHQLSVGDAGTAVDSLTQALAMWRGRAGDDVPRDSSIQEQLKALDDSRGMVEEDLAEARLVLGDGVHLVADLRAYIAQHPLRERPYDLLMRALYASGNPASALAVYNQARSTLAAELGLDPGQELQLTHRAILQHDVAALTVPPRLG